MTSRLDGYKTHLSPLVVDHDVVRLHIAMHDALRMAEIERLEARIRMRPLPDFKESFSDLQELEDIEPRIKVGEFGVKDLEVDIVNVFGHKTGYLGAGITDDV